jgi:phosphoadenosine phosphosulfate reductase
MSGRRLLAGQRAGNACRKSLVRNICPNQVESFHPRTGALEALVRENGINGFYHSTAARHGCCAVRKLEPLGRALRGAAAWLTGLRADESHVRPRLDFVSYDPNYQLVKINPLLDWSGDAIIAVVRDAEVPCNALHNQASCRSVAPLHARGCAWKPERPGAGGGSRTRPESAACI